jgi:hypothetical protein
LHEIATPERRGQLLQADLLTAVELLQGVIERGD